MEKQKLGTTGIDVSPICFGGNVFGWTVNDDANAFKLLDAFFDAGGNFIDTADVYPAWVPGNDGGESERAIGRWLKASGKRDKVVITTKVGMEADKISGGLGRAYIIKSIEDSLNNLQTDYVDLYLSHTDDTSVPFEETFSAYAQLLSQGKIRSIGASNYTADRLIEALKISKEHGLPKYQVFQTRYNLYDRNPYENELEPICEKNEIAVTTYSSLANGFLAGKYRSGDDGNKSVRGARAIERYLNDKGLRILKSLDEVAAEYKSTPASVALAWIISHKSVTAPIASATSVKQVTGLIEATRLKLSAEAIEKLTAASL